MKSSRVLRQVHFRKNIEFLKICKKPQKLAIHDFS